MKVISVVTDFKVIEKISKHIGLWSNRNHSPPPLPNIHPPPIDAIIEVEKYFQDDIPTDDMYIVDQPFSP
jgi:hypothetical protein